jgi:hypothetical protein
MTIVLGTQVCHSTGLEVQFFKGVEINGNGWLHKFITLAKDHFYTFSNMQNEIRPLLIHEFLTEDTEQITSAI